MFVVWVDCYINMGEKKLKYFWVIKLFLIIFNFGVNSGYNECEKILILVNKVSLKIILGSFGCMFVYLLGIKYYIIRFKIDLIW